MILLHFSIKYDSFIACGFFLIIEKLFFKEFNSLVTLIIEGTFIYNLCMIVFKINLCARCYASNWRIFSKEMKKKRYNCTHHTRSTDGFKRCT